MWKNINAQYELYSDDYEICPKTYVFPDDEKEFQHEIDNDDGSGLWIFKPNSASCGRGIKIFDKDDEIPKLRKKEKNDGFIISEYIQNPHLINGKKYDLRVYVMVTSYDPLMIYVYKEGLVRFATQKYSVDPESLKDRFVHLTNYSINKKSEDYIKNKGKDDEVDAAKWSLQQLRDYFEQNNLDWDDVNEEMNDIIIKTLISVESKINETMEFNEIHRQSCFEVYGFDIMIDDELQPWLVEVNVTPSLSSSSPFDKKLKTQLICDSLTLIGIIPFKRVEGEPLQNHIDQAHATHMKEIQKLFSTRARIARSHKGKDTSKKQGKDQIGGQEGDSSEDEESSEFDEESTRMDEIDALKRLKLGELTSEELDIILEYEEQGFRLGKYERIFPLSENIEYYEEFFPEDRLTHKILWRYLSKREINLDQYRRFDAVV